MIPERYEPVRQWLIGEFPDCRGVDVSVVNDAGSLLPAGAPALPYASGEPVVLFRVLEPEARPWQREVAIAKQVLAGYGAEQILGVLEREHLAERLRISPEHRLYLDRRLRVTTLAATWTGSEVGGGPIREG